MCVEVTDVIKGGNGGGRVVDVRGGDGGKQRGGGCDKREGLGLLKLWRREKLCQQTPKIGAGEPGEGEDRK